MYNAAAVRQRTIIYNRPHYSLYSPNHSCYLVFCFLLALFGLFLSFYLLCFHHIFFCNLSFAKQLGSFSTLDSILFHLFFLLLSFISLFWLSRFLSLSLLVSINFHFSSYFFNLSTLFRNLYLYFFYLLFFLLFNINLFLLFSKVALYFYFSFDCMPHSFVVLLGKFARIFKFILTISEKSLAIFGGSFSYPSCFFLLFSYIFLVCSALSYLLCFLSSFQVKLFVSSTFPYFCNYFFCSTLFQSTHHIIVGHIRIEFHLENVLEFSDLCSQFLKS